MPHAPRSGARVGWGILSLCGGYAPKDRVLGEVPIPRVFPPSPWTPLSPPRMPWWCSAKGCLLGPAPGTLVFLPVTPVGATLTLVLFSHSSLSALPALPRRHGDSEKCPFPRDEALSSRPAGLGTGQPRQARPLCCEGWRRVKLSACSLLGAVSAWQPPGKGDVESFPEPELIKERSVFFSWPSVTMIFHAGCTVGPPRAPQKPLMRSDLQAKADSVGVSVGLGVCERPLGPLPLVGHRPAEHSGQSTPTAL